MPHARKDEKKRRAQIDKERMAKVEDGRIFYIDPD